MIDEKTLEHLEAVRIGIKILELRNKRMREALEYYRENYTGAEPSVSVFERMVDEILGSE